MAPSVPGLPLQRGDTGESVRDLQHRLNAEGHPVPATELGVFGAGTEQAVRAFQQSHGLVADGTVDASTWAALVEASYRLGDRLLYLKSPMLRGDDVAQLQRRLNSLGFDAGRVDGIFGPDTERALKDFQRNVAVTVDGIFGPDTERALLRLGNRVEQPVPVAGVRERERLRGAPRKLQDRRIMVGESGGLDALAAALARSLAEAGARTIVSHHPDASTQALEANAFNAEAYLGVMLGPGERSTIAYYATSGFESIGGHHLAELVVDELERSTDLTLEPPAGMRLPVLRETKMPAVMCLLAPPDLVVACTAEIATALRRAVGRWIIAPAGQDGELRSH